jgi:hypothetical protein
MEENRKSVRQMMCPLVFGNFKAQILTRKISKSIRHHKATNIFKKAECGLCRGCLRVVRLVVVVLVVVLVVVV